MLKVKLKFKVFTLNSVTNSMEQNPSWEADISLASQEISPPRILWNPKCRYCIHRRPRAVPILSQISPVYASPFQLLHIHFKIILPSAPTYNISCGARLLNELLETSVPWDDAIVVSAGKLRKLWDSLSELCNSLCERRLERTVLGPALFPVKTAQFIRFLRQV